MTVLAVNEIIEDSIKKEEKETDLGTKIEGDAYVYIYIVAERKEIQQRRLRSSHQRARKRITVT